VVTQITKNIQYYKFCAYGFFKNLRFFDAFIFLFFLEKGLLFVQIGVLYAIREIVVVVMEIPSGVIADSLGRRKILVFSFFFYILSFITFYFSEHYIAFILGMTFYALGDALRSGVHKAMIYQYLKINNWSNQKVNYYGHTRSWSQLGSAVSALFAGVIVFYSGNYQSIFLASIIPYLIDMILVMSYPKSLDVSLKTFSRQAIADQFRKVMRAFVVSFKSIRFLKVLTSTSLYTGYFKSVKDYIQPLLMSFALAMPFFAYLDDEKKTAIMVGVIYFFIFLLTSRASRISGKLAARFKELSRPLNLTIAIGFAIGVIAGLTYASSYFVFAIIGFILIIIIENLRKPIGFAMIADQSKQKAMATTLSATSLTKSMFAVVISPLIGWIADLYSPGIAIAIVSLFLILIFPIYWLKGEKV
jgi:MFS family permease